MPFNGVNPSIRVYDYDVKERKNCLYFFGTSIVVLGEDDEFSGTSSSSTELTRYG